MIMNFHLSILATFCLALTCDSYVLSFMKTVKSVKLHMIRNPITCQLSVPQKKFVKLNTGVNLEYYHLASKPVSQPSDSTNRPPVIFVHGLSPSALSFSR
jgi:hypothetical protein